MRGSRAAAATALEQLLGTPADAAGDEGTHPDENLNHVSVAGRIVADPELRTSRNGLPYATIRIAVGQRKRTAEPFHVVVVGFGACAEVVAHLQPTELVRVDGRLGQRQWTAEDGTRIGARRIIAERVQALELAPTQPVMS